MKRFIALLISAIILTGCVGTIAHADECLHIYVQNGAVNGDGTINSPFGTLVEARDYIRSLKNSGAYPQNGVVVYLREGMYTITEPFVLDEQDSGTATAPVVYRSYLDEQVILIGGTQFDMGESSAVIDADILARLPKESSASVRQIDLKTKGITDYGALNVFGMGKSYFSHADVEHPSDPAPELFFDNDAMTLARYPNEGWVYTNEVLDPGDDVEFWWDSNKTKSQYVPPEDRVYPPRPSIFTVSDVVRERMANWEKADDVWIFGYFKEDWSDVSLPIAKIESESATITTDLPSPKKMEANRHFYFYNLLEELDAPGEYYLDRNSGILYFYPPKQSGTLCLGLTKTAFVEIDGASNISFKGISFKV
ncbi:MAG: hypothetical protein IJ454_00995, partial [Clostridia bacterium]|nr:hypothetical protein [Clostridia bacterium]